MIIEIALGISLGVLIIIYHKQIFAWGLRLIGGLIAIGILLTAGYYLLAWLPSLSPDKQQAKRAPALVPTSATPINTVMKKKYRLTSENGEHFEIDAADNATVEELKFATLASGKKGPAWYELLAEERGALVYADVASVTTFGNVATITWLTDYRKSVSPPKDYFSSTLRIAYHCIEARLQMISLTTHQHYMAIDDGKTVSPRDPKWFPLPADSGQQEKMFKFACGKT